MCARTPASFPQASDDGYRFAKCEGKPNVTHASKAAPNKDFCNSMPVRRMSRSDSIHCDA